DLRFRRPTLYPAELRAQTHAHVMRGCSSVAASRTPRPRDARAGARPTLDLAAVVRKFTHRHARRIGNMRHRVRVFAARAGAPRLGARILTERAGFEPAMGL